MEFEIIVNLKTSRLSSIFLVLINKECMRYASEIHYSMYQNRWKKGISRSKNPNSFHSRVNINYCRWGDFPEWQDTGYGVIHKWRPLRKGEGWSKIRCNGLGVGGVYVWRWGRGREGMVVMGRPLYKNKSTLYFPQTCVLYLVLLLKKVTLTANLLLCFTLSL